MAQASGADDNVLAKVRKLLAKAEDPSCSPGEAEAFTEKASALIAKYGIDRAMLAAGDPDSDVIGDRVLAMDPPYAMDKAELLSGVAHALRCRAVRRVEYPRGRKRLSVHLFGFGSDLERVELLYTSLLVQSAHALAATPVPPWEHAAAFRRSWLTGFTSAVVRRLREAERRVERETEARRTGGLSVELVLADRARLVERRVSEEYPRLRTAPPRRLSGGGLPGGYAAGHRADLGADRVRGSGTAGITRGA
ncbi:MAG: DUF2786 domain-containing protein [Nocardioidaceae bacterium]